MVACTVFDPQHSKVQSSLIFAHRQAPIRYSEVLQIAVACRYPIPCNPSNALGRYMHTPQADKKINVACTPNFPWKNYSDLFTSVLARIWYVTKCYSMPSCPLSFIERRKEPCRTCPCDLLGAPFSRWMKLWKLIYMNSYKRTRVITSMFFFPAFPTSFFL